MNQLNEILTFPSKSIIRYYLGSNQKMIAEIKKILLVAVLILININSAYAKFSLIEKHEGFEIYENERIEGEQSIVILKGNIPIYTIAGNMLTSTLYNKETNLLGNNKDILVVKDWTGGAHCCDVYYFVELEKESKQILRINAWDYELEFIKQSVGEAYKIKMYDSVFKYFYACFADSIVPEVILRFNGNACELDFHSMKHVISAEKFDERIKNLEKKLSKELKFTYFIEEAVDLIYSGNTFYALKMIDEVFPKYEFNDLKAEEFKKALMCRIKKSTYVGSLKKMNAPYLNLPVSCEKEKNNPFAF